MDNKFAKIRLSQTIHDIPVRPEAFKKAPLKLLKLYINRFNPYRVQNISINDCAGLEVFIPMTKEIFDEALFAGLMERTLEDLEGLGITAIDPIGLDYDFSQFFVPKGNIALIFFMESVIKNYCKTFSKELKNIEIAVIEGNVFETSAIIDLIYLNYNYLSIIIEENQEEDYSQLTEGIFEDCGLNLSFGKRGSSILKNADIIINLSENPKGYETSLKRGACLIELSGSTERIAAVKTKRADIFSADKNGYVYVFGKKLTLAEYEMYLYVKYIDFERLIKRGIAAKNAFELLANINSIIISDKAKLHMPF